MTTITVGPQNATTDPRSGLRKYRWQGRDLTSVTSMRRAAGIPHGLHQWTISQVVKRAVEEHDELTAMLTRERRPRERVLDKNRREEASRWLRQASTEERDAKAALGTAVHDLAAQGRTPADVPDVITVRRDGSDIEVDGVSARRRLAHYLDWLEVSGAEPVLAERQVWNLAIGYAGSFDLIARMRDGSYWMIDIKTGSGTYAEHLLQILAYLMAEFVGEDGNIDDEATAILKAVSGAAVLQLSEDGWEFVALRPDAIAWQAFRGLVAFAMWTIRNPDLSSLTIGKRAGFAPKAPEGPSDLLEESQRLGIPVGRLQQMRDEEAA